MERQRAPDLRESVRCPQLERPACGLAASQKPGCLAYDRDGQPLARERSWIPGSLIRSGRDQGELRRSLARARRAIGVAIAITGVFLPAVNAGTKATAAADPGFRPVTYRGVARRGQNDWNTVDATIRLVNLDRLNPQPVLTAV